MAETARRRDVIEAPRPVTPADAAAMAARFDGVSTAAMLAELLAGDLRHRVAVVSSFGAESAVLLHMIAAIDRSVPVVFVDTQQMFDETLAYRDRLIERLGLTDLRIVHPDPLALAARDGEGLRWSYDPDGCCDLRKVAPLARALAPFDAWLSGRKGYQAVTRAALPRFEADDGRLKINPLVGWERPEIAAYFAAHDLPPHPLEAQGFASIGCAPCTSKVRPGEDPRAGRWRGLDKVECGIHRPAGGDGYKTETLA